MSEVPAIPTPTATVPVRSQVSFREYEGIFAPSGKGGPRTLGASSAAGWVAGRTGAIFSAAHVAATADPRQADNVWRGSVGSGDPVDAVQPSLARFSKQHDQARAQTSAKTPGLDEPPAVVWQPNVREVGFSDVKETGSDVTVTVWARQDGEVTWFRRTVTVRWTRGDWRLVLSPRPGSWSAATPTPGINAFTQL